MSILGRLLGSRPADTGHDPDHELLGQLSERSDLMVPRRWVHYVYCADPLGAQQVADRVAAAGWDVQRVSEAAEGPEWVVIAEQDGVVLSAPVVRAARRFFEDAAASVPGGDYDGWEAST